MPSSGLLRLDRVDGLGEFTELEVVLEEADTAQDGQLEALDLMRRLGIEPTQLSEGAYVDLLQRAGA